MKTWTTPSVEELNISLTANGTDDYGFESIDYTDRSWLYWLCDQCKNNGSQRPGCGTPGCGESGGSSGSGNSGDGEGLS